MRQWFAELKVVHKLLLMGLFFLLPDSAMLCMLVSGANENIAFAQQEVRGNAYLRPLVHLLYLVPRYQRALLNQSGSSRQRELDLADISGQIDDWLGKLDQVDQASAVQLKFTDSELALRGRSQARPMYLRSDWKALQSGSAGADAQATFEHLLGNLRVMITHAGDMSNLILDPDLDSYYLMDATLLSIPAVEDQLSQAAGDGDRFLAAGRSGDDELSKMHSAILRQSLNHISNSIETAMREETGSTKAQMRERLTPRLDDFRNSLEGFITTTDTLASGSTSTTAYYKAACQARDAGMRLWDFSSEQLDNLLLARIGSYQRRQQIAILITAAAILAASLMVSLINRSINLPLQRQAQSLRKLNDALTREGQLLLEAQTALVEASRRAGMAEIATGVLHNVGNVLNSVNTSATMIREKVEQSKVPTLSRAAAMLREHQDNTAAFIANDPKGRMFPELLGKLAEVMEGDRESITQEVNQLVKNVDHIKSIVHAQQSFTKAGERREVTDLAELIEDALRINGLGRGANGMEIVRRFEPMPAVVIDKHSVLQILVNLVGNAKKAINDSGREPRRLNLALLKNDNEGGPRARIEVTDTGVGIAPENLRKIFQHGFTTRKDGHGFGLHSAANDANAMGGSLSVSSPGAGQGATFTLEIPLAQAEVVEV